jgi:tight adherence protein C
MTAPVLGAAWAVLVLAGAWRLRLPAGHRLPVSAAPASRRRLSPRARRLAVAGIAVTVAGTVALPLAPLVGAAAWAMPGVRRRRARRTRAAAVVRDLPEAVDLLLLAVGAGLTVPLAVEAVARRGAGPVAAELEQVVAEVRLGRRLADALDEVPARLDGGEATRPLVAALLASERYGAPLIDRLERLAAEVRADRRRRAEEAARRVPVQLLFPLVLCVLPAFALLTVAPLIAGALSSLRP